MRKDKDPSSTTGGRHPALTPARATPAAQDRNASLPSAARGSVADAPPDNERSYSVELHIEELVLHGFAGGERYRVGEAIERELTRLFTEHGAPPALAQGGEMTQLDGGAFEVQPGPDAEATGVRLAQAIYGGFAR